MYYTTSTAFLEALAEAGVSRIFANLGSDHPGLSEALALARAEGRENDLPELVVCPHETVALSAAHACAQVTRCPQAVIVHVDSGTQNLGGAVNNAMRGRVPVLIFAGAAPYAIEGELPGGRNEWIHWIQDVHDQRGILRNYVKYDNELRAGRTVKQVVHRALQIAASEPTGPVYLVGPREVMEQPLEPPPGLRSCGACGARARRRPGDRPPARGGGAPADRHVLPRPRPGRGARARRACRDARDPGHRVRGQLHELPRRPPDAPRLAVHHQDAEPAARRGGRHPRRGQRRSVDSRVKPPVAWRGGLRDRHRPAEVVHVHVAHPRADQRRRQLEAGT